MLESIADSLRSSWGALMLRDDSYAEVRDDPSVVMRGLAVVLVVAILASLAILIGQVLSWATSPDMADLQDMVLYHLQRMPWYRDLAGDPGFLEGFVESYERGWSVLPRLFGAPNLGGAALGLVTRPISFLIAWLILSLVIHVAAHLLGGSGSLAQTLGCLGLAAAPQLLSLLQIIPGVRVGSLAAIWTFLCAYSAVKSTHGMGWGKTALAALSPLILLVLFDFVILGLVALVAILASI
jgi:hypothetical protein